MKPRQHRRLLSALVVATLCAALCRALGIPFSQRAAVSQTVAFTEITVFYGRSVDAVLRIQ